VVAGGSMSACGGDERLELRTGAMSLSEDGLASTWDYAINNPLLTQQHGFPPWPPSAAHHWPSLGWLLRGRPVVPFSKAHGMLPWR
jgi:hypothetical protein